jgi:F0F1-type ATP synthase assembly protein I
MMMMAAVLIAGLLQYAMVGYFIGWLIEKLFGESAGSMPAPPRG